MASQLSLGKGVPAAGELEGQSYQLRVVITGVVIAWSFVIFVLGVCAGRCSRKPKAPFRRTGWSPVREGSYLERFEHIHG